MAGSLSNQDKTTPNDRPEVVVTDETSGLYGEVKTYNGENRQLVEARINLTAPGSTPSVSNKLRFDDMNASNGGVARDTVISGLTWTQVYYYSGSGLFMGFLITIDSLSDWLIRLQVDSTNEILGAGGIAMSDITSTSLYGYGDNQEQKLGIFRSGNTFHYNSVLDFPIRYTTNVKILATPIAGKNKPFKAGLVSITKET